MPMHNLPHPGLTVRHDCLEPLGLTVTEGAKVLGVTRQALNNLVNGKGGNLPGNGRAVIQGFRHRPGNVVAAANGLRPRPSAAAENQRQAGCAQRSDGRPAPVSFPQSLRRSVTG